ncbi:acetate reductase vrdA [Acrasis kona]|uniref:Acetate reductase vrdA n=1 Tax=Acrasis kona TaxID=1008807 RepID=A0AAW2YKZ2_9EUKA
MEYKRLGNTGLKVSRICLGCMTFGNKNWAPWVIDNDQAFEIIKKAWESGINFFDTANVYSNGDSERVLGDAIKKLNIPRDQIVLATKCYGLMRGTDQPLLAGGTVTEDKIDTVTKRGLSRKSILDAVNASLERLQVDYIDLYQIHRWDYDTPIEETMETLNDLVRSGKVRYIGASSMYAWQFAKAQHIADKKGWAKFVSMQDLYNLTYREEEREMIPLCLDQGVGLIPWSPLAGGALVREDNTTRSDAKMGELGFMGTEAEKKIVDKVKEVASNKGVERAQVALAWVLSKKAVTSPIVGVSKMYQLEQALGAFKVKLTDDEIKSLEEIYQPKPISGHK